MRLLKVTVTVLFLLVACVYGATSISKNMSGSKVPPQLHCPQEVLEVSVLDPDSALLAGVTASDAQDGDLTARVQVLSVSKLITADTARVTYLVFDSDENMATASRRIRYTDYHAPTFAIDQPLVYAKNQAIPLLDRLTVTDVLDGDITGNIRVSALSATADSEVYTVALQATNSMGDTTRLTLPVILQEGTAARPKIALRTQLLYLAQGDGFDARDQVAGITCPLGQADPALLEISGQVDTGKPGTYMVYYRYPYNGVMGLSILTVVVQ